MPALSSPFLTSMMAALPVLVGTGFVLLVAWAAGLRSGVIAAIVLGGLMTTQFAVASSGALRQWDKIGRAHV